MRKLAVPIYESAFQSMTLYGTIRNNCSGFDVTRLTGRLVVALSICHMETKGPNCCLGL